MNTFTDYWLMAPAAIISISLICFVSIPVFIERNKDKKKKK